MAPRNVMPSIFWYAPPRGVFYSSTVLQFVFVIVIVFYLTQKSTEFTDFFLCYATLALELTQLTRVESTETLLSPTLTAPADCPPETGWTSEAEGVDKTLDFSVDLRFTFPFSSFSFLLSPLYFTGTHQ